MRRNREYQDIGGNPFLLRPENPVEIGRGNPFGMGETQNGPGFSMPNIKMWSYGTRKLRRMGVCYRPLVFSLLHGEWRNSVEEKSVFTCPVCGDRGCADLTNEHFSTGSDIIRWTVDFGRHPREVYYHNRRDYEYGAVKLFHHALIRGECQGTGYSLPPCHDYVSLQVLVNEWLARRPDLNEYWLKLKFEYERKTK